MKKHFPIPSSLAPIAALAFLLGTGGENEALISDAITSATPLLPSSELTGGHSGYGNPACGSCHPGAHAGHYQEPGCAHCHGANGAPPRPVPHEETDCADCHAKAHPTLSFPSPGGCVACHPFATSSSCGAVELADVVVIGAGGGGLSAGAVLSRAGLKVTVLEKNDKVGGNMSGFTIGDYRFEATLHGFDGLRPAQGMNEKLFTALGIADRVTPVESAPVQFRAVLPGRSVDVPADAALYRDRLAGLFPLERAGIEALFADLEELHRILKVVTDPQKDDSSPALSLSDLQKLSAYLEASFAEVLSRYVKHPDLLAVLSMIGGFAGTGNQEMSGLMGMAILASYHLGGFYYFVGGSRSISEALAAVIQEHGGSLRKNALATKITLKNGKASEVRTQDGTCYRARYVVSNASARSTLLQMVGKENLPADYRESLEAMMPSGSALVVYLGLNRDFSAAFGSTHEIMVASDDASASSPLALDDCDIEKHGLIATNYTMLDPESAPAGKNVVMLMTSLSYDCLADPLADGGYSDYKRQKDALAVRLIQKAEQWLPGLSAAVLVMEVSTPQSLEGYTRGERGSYLGWQHTREQSFVNRLPQATPIPNLFLAGSWTYPSGGQSAALQSGLQAAKLVLEQERNNR